MLSLRLTSNQFVTHLWDIFLPSVTSSSKVRSSQPLVWTQWQPGKPSLFENKTYLYIGHPDCPKLVLNASIVRRPLCEFPRLRPTPMYGNPERIQRELKWQSQHFHLFYGLVQLRELFWVTGAYGSGTCLFRNFHFHFRLFYNYYCSSS
jgi:hypothetical protein